MKRYRSIKTEYEICDLCGMERPRLHSYSLGRSEGSKWFCTPECQAYYYFPTRELYLANRAKELGPEEVETEEINKKSSVASFTASGNKTGGHW